MLNVELFRPKKVVMITTSRAEQRGFAPESIDLQFENIPAENLTEATTKTRHGLKIALTARLCGRAGRSRMGIILFQ